MHHVAALSLTLISGGAEELAFSSARCKFLGVTRLVAVGIDAGSTTTKLVGVSADGCAHRLAAGERDPCVEEQVARMLAICAPAGRREEMPTVATGYGRELVRRDGACHRDHLPRAGVHAMLGPAARWSTSAGRTAR